MSSPLDRIEADKLRDQLRDALNGRFVGDDIAWDILSTWDALVTVAKAAEDVVNSKTRNGGHFLFNATAVKKLDETLWPLRDSQEGTA